MGRTQEPDAHQCATNAPSAHNLELADEELLCPCVELRSCRVAGVRGKRWF